MLRTQVQLTPEQVRRLRTLARQHGVSLAALVRESVDHLLNDPARQMAVRYQRASTLVGAFVDREAAPDLSRRHDMYLRESYE